MNWWVMLRIQRSKTDQLSPNLQMLAIAVHQVLVRVCWTDLLERLSLSNCLGRTFPFMHLGPGWWSNDPSCKIPFYH